MKSIILYIFFAWHELTAFLNNAPNLFWKYRFDVLSSLRTFFFLSSGPKFQHVTVRFASVIRLLFDVDTVFTVYINICIVKGTDLINKACMKNSFKRYQQA